MSDLSIKEKWFVLCIKKLKDRGEELEKLEADYMEIATKQGLTIMNMQKLIEPCDCKNRIGKCVPCAMRDRVAAGDSIEEVVKDND